MDALEGLTVLDFTGHIAGPYCTCLLYTSDAADERSSVDLGGRRIIKKTKNTHTTHTQHTTHTTKRA